MRLRPVYLQQILRTCQKVGVDGRLGRIGAEITAEALCTEIERLSADPAVAGIIRPDAAARPTFRSGRSSTR